MRGVVSGFASALAGPANRRPLAALAALDVDFEAPHQQLTPGCDGWTKDVLAQGLASHRVVSSGSGRSMQREAVRGGQPLGMPRSWPVRSHPRSGTARRRADAVVGRASVIRTSVA